MDINNNETFSNSNSAINNETCEFKIENIELLKNKIERQHTELVYQGRIDYLENQLLFYDLELKCLAIESEGNSSNLKTEIAALKENLRLKNDEVEKEKNLRLNLFKQIQEQQEYISKLELDKVILDGHLREMEKNINDISTLNVQLNYKINELNRNYSSYYRMENENKLIFDILGDIEKENTDFDLITDQLYNSQDENITNKYKALIKIFYSQKKIFNKMDTDQREKNKYNENMIEKLKVQNDHYMNQFQEIERKNRSLLYELKTANEYREMALNDNQKLEEKLDAFKSALTEDFKKSLKEFYKELSTCTDTLAKLVYYIQDVSNNKTKSLMDVSALNAPTLFDEKTWDANLLFKKEFWLGETKKLRDLKQNYIGLKIKYKIIALTDII